MYDIVFLSYQEPNAQEHWELVKGRFPRARRVHGISGIVAAHQLAASLCKTRYFWVIDADNIINDDFNLTHSWPRTDDKNHVSVWKARNNINGLEYGYGGIKLLPRKEVLKVSDKVVDFTTSISDHFHPMEEVASVTIINTSPFEAWKAGFRECVKLSSGIIRNGHSVENVERLEHWETKTLDVPYAKECMDGATAGRIFGSAHANDYRALACINKWEWLRDRFDN